MHKLTKEELLVHKRNYNKNYRHTHPKYRKKIYAYNKDYRNKHIEDCRKNLRKSERKRRQFIKNEILKLLGNQCINPYGEHKEPYTNILALQIDHINGGGNKARKKVNVTKFYLDILKEIQNGSKDYQLLCANCNWIKRFKNKEQEQPIDNEKKTM